jgi:hypothetical protein
MCLLFELGIWLIPLPRELELSEEVPESRELIEV